MKKIILIMALALVSGNAMAEWEFLTSDDDYNIYIDKDNILVKGNKTRMWLLFRFSTRQPATQNLPSHFAIRVMAEYDCKMREERIVVMSFLDEKESLVKSIDFPDDWGMKPVPPGTAGWLAMEAACNN